MWPQFGSRPRLLMLIGVVLLLSPTLVSGFTLGAQTHHYGVGYIEPVDDGIRYGEYAAHGRADEEILCWGTLTRACQLERTLIDGNTTIEHGDGGERPGYADYRFVYHDETFYEIGASAEELWLRPVNATTAFRATALDPNAVPDHVLAELENGTLTFGSHADLPVHQLIPVGEDRYATIAEGYSERTVLDRFLHPLDALLGPVGFLAGLVFLLEGYHQRYVER